MRYAVNWTQVLESSGFHKNLTQLVNESWPIEKCSSWDYDTSLVQSSIVIDVSIQNEKLDFYTISSNVIVRGEGNRLLVILLERKNRSFNFFKYFENTLNTRKR